MIHELIVDQVIQALQAALIDSLPADDPARAGVVMRGPLQGDPDPDQARISVTVHECDPDAFYGGSVTGLKGDWSDQIAEAFCGGGAIWNRRFTVKARCLTVNTGEGLLDARRIASTVRGRIERALLEMDWSGVAAEDGEYVARPVESETLQSEAVQGGGPPDSYDYFVKVRFDVQTETFS